MLPLQTINHYQQKQDFIIWGIKQFNLNLKFYFHAACSNQPSIQ